LTAIRKRLKKKFFQGKGVGFNYGPKKKAKPICNREVMKIWDLEADCRGKQKKGGRKKRVSKGESTRSRPQINLRQARYHNRTRRKKEAMWVLNAKTKRKLGGEGPKLPGMGFPS